MSNRIKIFTYDFDHNILHTETTWLLKNPDGELVEVKGEKNAKYYIEHQGYTIIDEMTSFQNYCDIWPRGTNVFVDDLVNALDKKLYWPSYSSYRNTIINAYDHAIITSRGHHVESLKAGFSILIHDILSQCDKESFFDNLQQKYRRRWIEEKKDKLLDRYYDEIGWYPVNNDQIKQMLFDPGLGKKWSAFRHYIQAIHERYPNQPLSVWFSDDLTKNIQEISYTIALLRKHYPHIHFVTYNTENPKNIIKIRHTLKQHHNFDDIVQDIVVW